jgi:hypothetical protein
VLATVERLRATHGDLYWRPAASLVRLATSGGTFAAHARTP